MEKCIFICDDDMDILDICRIILESEGMKVVTCSTAESLYSNLNEHKPHMIFVDNGLKGMAGKDVITYLKQDELYKDVPVLLFSANAEIENIAKTAKADGWLAKPFNIGDLRNKVQSFLN